MKHIILSVGAYTCWEVKKLCRNKNLIFYCYDPLPGVYKDFQNTFADIPNVHFFNKAIGISNAIRYLKCEKTASRLIDTAKVKDGTFIEVKTTTLGDAVHNILVDNGQDIKLDLVMNCEGEEIALIHNCTISFLEMFNSIKIEFHPQYYPVSLIDTVIRKLNGKFNFTKSATSISKQPVYYFERRK